MAIAYSNSYNALQTTALGGLGGGPNLTRSSVAGGRLSYIKAKFVVPATGPGSANGDVIYLWPLYPVIDIAYIQVITTAWGSGVTLSIGKLDANNASNTDPVHYAAATSVASAGSFLAAGTNLGEEFGPDPMGDTSVGNTPPGLGGSTDIITATIGGGTPTTGAILMVLIFYSAGG